LNRKEGIAVSLVLLISFVGGVFAAPGVQQVFVTNFPSNQQVTVSNFPKNQNVTVTNPAALTSHITSVDITILDSPALPIIINPNNQNYTAAFSFAPVMGFTQVTSVLLTTEVNNGNGYVSQESVELNGKAPALSSAINSCCSTNPSSIVLLLPSQDIRVGSNTINIGIISNTLDVLSLVRLTVEYTYLG